VIFSSIIIFIYILETVINFWILLKLQKKPLFISVTFKNIKWVKLLIPEVFLLNKQQNILLPFFKIYNFGIIINSQ